jgi:hypothetical protein
MTEQASLTEQIIRPSVEEIHASIPHKGVQDLLNDAKNTQRRMNRELEDIETDEDLKRTGGALSDADQRTLEAIEAFEQKYGRGTFRWNRASCKELFYSSTEGTWPEPEELRRIRDYLVATGAVAS